PRPGRDEKIFNLIKFRTMTCETDKDGNLLPDDARLTKYGKFLRSTSLDELPELINILMGDMAVIGPRPQLVRDMVFMTDIQRMRHTVRPGLSGLAQINGRNAIKWENKLSYDLEYIENITFIGDIKIIFETFVKVFQRADIFEEGMETAEDLGDYLLKKGDRAGGFPKEESG
ncbi:MAG: sugar transferase, partial [Clostridia bacterium]|nr:sugar transferase [Clostridia bacterium]